MKTLIRKEIETVTLKTIDLELRLRKNIAQVTMTKMEIS
jgi:hypothetical protein